MAWAGGKRAALRTEYKVPIMATSMLMAAALRITWGLNTYIMKGKL